MPGFIAVVDPDQPEGPPRYLVEVAAESPLRGAGSTTITGLGSVGAAVADACTDIVEHLAATMSAAAPTEVELELGVSISADGGIPLITKLATEGAIKVVLRWDRSAMQQLSTPRTDS